MEVSMRTLRKLLFAPLALLTALSSPAFAQDQAPDSQALANAVTEHLARQDAERLAIREALSRPEVQDVAARAGIDLKRAASAVEVLNGAELEHAAKIAGEVNDSLVGGGSTIVISTTTIIIILLLVLVILVAAK
jgi:hypothetical protein